MNARTKPAYEASCSDAAWPNSSVIPREGGESSTPRPYGSIADVSGILGHPPQCAIAHKAGDDRFLVEGYGHTPDMMAPCE
jgi:hypothetical protein